MGIAKDKRLQPAPSRLGEGRAANPRTLIVCLYGGVLALALLLLFYNLDGRLLWGDEAETAVLAKNVVKFGVPKTVDGLNHITLHGSGIEDNKDNIWVWSPWLQEYVAAAAFRLFGPTTWASRAPFALIAWFSLVWFSFTAYGIYRDHWVALSSLILLGTSEFFLLHARQCRYYSISILGEILLIYAAYLLIVGNRKGAILLALALSLQFYSNYIIALANLPALVPLAWLASRENKRATLRILIGVAVFLLIAGPWILYAKPWQKLGLIHDPYDAWEKARRYVRDFHFYFLPLAFGLLPLGAAIFNHLAGRSRRRTAKTEKNVAASVFPREASGRVEIYLICLLPLYAVMLLIPPAAFMRYLLPLLPVACLLAAAWVFRYVKWRIVAVSIILLQCSTNALAVITGLPFSAQHRVRAPLVIF